LPILHRVVQVPVFAPDGTLQTAPGYHSAARVYYAPPKGLTIDDVPANPTPDDITQARRLILEHVLEGFPFVSDADRAHAVALILLLYARDLIKGQTPLHSVESALAGTGKGLLVDVSLRPALGPRIGVIVQTNSEDEWRKRITAALMESPGAIIIDNVKKPLASGALASVLTVDYWQDRILGRSKIVTLPVRCVWLATGNNLALDKETARRSIRIRLDAQCSRPWERPATDFKHPNLKEWVDQHRTDLVRAALVLIQAWIAASRPLWKEKTLGNYEQWSMTMGGVLEVAGIEGFLGNLDDFYQAADAESESWELFVGKWWEKFHQKSVGAGELFQLALESDIELSGNNNQGLLTSFGVQLRGRRDQVIGKFKIIRAGQSNRAIQWSLKPIHLKEVKVDAGGGTGGDGDGEHGHDRARGVSINPDDFEKASGQ